MILREKVHTDAVAGTFLERRQIAAPVENPAGQITGWITPDDVTQVLMGERV